MFKTLSLKHRHPCTLATRWALLERLAVARRQRRDAMIASRVGWAESSELDSGRVRRARAESDGGEDCAPRRRRSTWELCTRATSSNGVQRMYFIYTTLPHPYQNWSSCSHHLCTHAGVAIKRTIQIDRTVSVHEFWRLVEDFLASLP